MKTKPMIIIGVTLLAIGLISFFMIYPTIQTALGGYKELQTSKDTLKAAQDKNKAVNELTKTKEQLTSIANIAQNYIPKAANTGELVIELAAIAQTNNLVVSETSLDKTATPAAAAKTEDVTTTKSAATPAPASSGTTTSSVTATGIQSINFSMKMTGKYPDFLNFLKTIENSSKLIVIKNFTLQMVQGTTDSSLTVLLSGSSFYKPQLTITDTIENIKVTAATINSFLNLKSYGQPVSTTESGFGRSDPFAGY